MDEAAQWERVVRLMGGDLEALGRDPAVADRLVLRVAAAMHRCLEQLRVRMAVGASDLDAIFALWDGGRCTPTELGRRVVLTRAAITTLTDRLVLAGYVERRVDPTDRRRLLLVVTPRADQLLMEATREVRAMIGAITERDGWREHARVLADLHAAFTTGAEQLACEHASRMGTPARTGVSAPVAQARPDHW